MPVPAEANDAAAACPDAVRFNTRVGAAAADGAAMLMMDAVLEATLVRRGRSEDRDWIVALKQADCPLNKNT